MFRQSFACSKEAQLSSLAELSKRLATAATPSVTIATMSDKRLLSELSAGYSGHSQPDGMLATAPCGGALARQPTAERCTQ